MDVEGEQQYAVKCAVPECTTLLREGDWHYALGGLGQVKTCVWCATQRPLRYRDGQRDVVEPRGWDRLPDYVTGRLYQQLRRPAKC